MGKQHRYDHRPIGVLLFLAAWVLVLHGTWDLPWGGLWWLGVSLYCLAALVAHVRETA